MYYPDSEKDIQRMAGWLNVLTDAAKKKAKKVAKKLLQQAITRTAEHIEETATADNP